LRATGSGEDLRNKWFGAQSGPVVIVGVLGRFSPEKGPDHFLHAFSHAAARRPDLRAVMVGDGPLLARCRSLAERLGIAQRVVFPGFRSDLASIYEALDLVVIPSRSEGLPTVLLEAMLMGVAVLSTRVGGVPDLVRDGQSALLVESGDREALAESLIRLAGDRALRVRLAGEAQKMARNRLSVEVRTSTILGHAQSLRAGEPVADTPGNE
jgi:glycosyltransferase involved in cell wall biosynthesis